MNTYKADDLTKKYDKVYVVGVTGQQLPDEKIASEMVRRFEERGVKANASMFTFHPKMDFGESLKTVMTDSLKDHGYDAVLTFALVGRGEEQDPVDIGDYDTPSGPIDYPYYNDYYDYYSYFAPMVYSKGYQASNTVFNMEAVLFDVEDSDLIWSAMSETVEPTSMDEFAEGYAKTIADKLIYEDVLSR